MKDGEDRVPIWLHRFVLLRVIDRQGHLLESVAGLLLCPVHGPS